MIAYLTVCLYLSRRIRLYPLDFGPFLVYVYCFVHRVNLKFTPKIPTPFQHGNVKKLSGEGTPLTTPLGACGASTDLVVPPALNWCPLAFFTLAMALQTLSVPVTCYLLSFLR